MFISFLLLIARIFANFLLGVALWSQQTCFATKAGRNWGQLVLAGSLSAWKCNWTRISWCHSCVVHTASGKCKFSTHWQIDQQHDTVKNLRISTQNGTRLCCYLWRFYRSFVSKTKDESSKILMRSSKRNKMNFSSVAKTHFWLQTRVGQQPLLNFHPFWLPSPPNLCNNSKSYTGSAPNPRPIASAPFRRRYPAAHSVPRLYRIIT